MRRLAVTLAALSLAGCAGTALDAPPERSWTVARPLDATVSCAVAALNSRSGVPFSARIISPGKIYDIRPERQLIAGSDPVILRASSAGPSETRLELHSTGVLGGELVTPHIAECV